MDQESKGYFTRSKAKKLADEKKNNKPHYAKKSIKFRKVVRIDHHDEDRKYAKMRSKKVEESITNDEVKKDSCKIDITEDATNLLTAIRNHPVITFCLDGKPNIKIEVDRYVLGGTVLALVLILWLASVI